MRWIIVNAVRAGLGVLFGLPLVSHGLAPESDRLPRGRLIAEQYRRQAAEPQARQVTGANRREQARAEAEEWLRQLAAESLGTTSRSYQEALRLYRDSQQDAALERLGENSLQADLATSRQRLEDAGQGWLLRGKILALRLDFAGADRAYAGAVKAAPASFEAWFQQGSFYQQRNRHREARKSYERALLLARRAGSLPDVAEALNNLGVLHGDENRKADARAAHEEALRIRRLLAQQNSELYLPDVASSLTNLGVLHRAENRQAEARVAYEEALRMRRELEFEKPDVYLPDIAMTLNNLGNLHRQENRQAEARPAYEEALRIRRELAEKNPGAYLPDLAVTLNNLGGLHREENRNADAHRAYGEALDI